MLRIALLFAALVAASINATPLFSPKYHPIVIWHGLGDSAYSQGMLSLASELKEAFPGVYVHLIDLADNLSADQKAGFFGNVNDQIEHVCEDLKQVKELKNGFDAIGFSQGGAYACLYLGLGGRS
jgi:palmitoyl-protein thioesterase